MSKFTCPDCGDVFKTRRQLLGHDCKPEKTTPTEATVPVRVVEGAATLTGTASTKPRPPAEIAPTIIPWYKLPPETKRLSPGRPVQIAVFGRITAEGVAIVDAKLL